MKFHNNISINSTVKQPAIIAIALTLGAIAAIATARWMGVQSNGADAPWTTVVVVAEPIEAGKAITAEQIKGIRWPGSAAPEQAANSTAEVIGRIARVYMMPGEPVLEGKLAPKDASGGLSSIIPEGKRAITVSVNEVVAVAGFALPGSYVDVLVSGKDDNKQSFSRTVLSRVKVLAVAQETMADPDKPKVVNAVTLELTPHESEKLDLARNIGKLSLVLRNEFDTGEVASLGVRIPDIVYPNANLASASAATTPAASSYSYRPEEIRGTNRQHVAKP